MLSGEGTREEEKVKLGHPTPAGTLVLQFYQGLYTLEFRTLDFIFHVLRKQVENHCLKRYLPVPFEDTSWPTVSPFLLYFSDLLRTNNFFPKLSGDKAVTIRHFTKCLWENTKEINIQNVYQGSLVHETQIIP